MLSINKTYLVVIASTLVALCTGFAISYYWITDIYLSEKIEANANALKLKHWYRNDHFHPPVDGQINQEQVVAFIKVNKDLAHMLERIRRKFEEKSWFIAIDVIQMQPEWQEKKFLALKKHNLSPLEYDWIVDQVIHFWAFQWQKQYLQDLRELGWNFDNLKWDANKYPQNYDILKSYESELNDIINILWPATGSTGNIIITDSL